MWLVTEVFKEAQAYLWLLSTRLYWFQAAVSSKLGLPSSPARPPTQFVSLLLILTGSKFNTIGTSVPVPNLARLASVSWRYRLIMSLMLGLHAASGTKGCVSSDGKHCNLLLRMISDRTLPRYPAANPLCCDQNIIKVREATLYFNALHVRFVTRALAV